VGERLESEAVSAVDDELVVASSVKGEVRGGGSERRDGDDSAAAIGGESLEGGVDWSAASEETAV
jgi:hypothetical protein